MPLRPAALLMPLVALGAAACVAPYDPYVAAPAPAYVAPAPYAASPYATPMPRYVGEGEILRGERRGTAGPAYAAAIDPYCREAYANLAGAQRQAEISGTYEDAARAARTEGFYRRDC